MDSFDNFAPPPPDEDFDALMEDEAELEVLRQIELEREKLDQISEHQAQSPVKIVSPKKLLINDENEENYDDLIDEYLSTGATGSKSPERKRLKRSSESRSPLQDATVRTENCTDAVEELTKPAPYRIPQIGDRKIYRRRPTGTDYQSLTLSDGTRFYLRFKDDPEEMECLNLESGEKYKRMGICGVPYSILYNQALVEQSNISAEYMQQEEEMEVGYGEDLNNNSKELWVDKFRPRNFLELLSDDGTNRTLLRWLKLWDKLVFNKEKKIRVSQKPKDESKSSFKAPPTELNEELDSQGRPMQKVALLHGPPGLGKTTLAHVIAATAGYNVVEMNASDDRSLSKFKEKLVASTQMKSVINQDRKPNCLIIDEIDGSPLQTINFLVNTIVKSGSGSTEKSKKRKKDEILIQRPIICICNDLYVPALRPLRQHALLVPFPPTLSSRLAQRLQDIALREKMKADQTALLALAEKSSNDIRACLSTLQFFKSKGQTLKAIDVHKTFVGQKDAQKSHFSVWKELFQIPKSSSKRKFLDEFSPGTLREESLSSLPVRYKNMLRTAQACGDYDRIMQGVFENYLEIKFKDVALQNVSI